MTTGSGKLWKLEHWFWWVSPNLKCTMIVLWSANGLLLKMWAFGFSNCKLNFIFLFMEITFSTLSLIFSGQTPLRRKKSASRDSWFRKLEKICTEVTVQILFFWLMNKNRQQSIQITEFYINEFSKENDF